MKDFRYICLGIFIKVSILFFFLLFMYKVEFLVFVRFEVGKMNTYKLLLMGGVKVE